MTIIISCFPLSFLGGLFAFIGQLAAGRPTGNKGKGRNGIDMQQKSLAELKPGTLWHVLEPLGYKGAPPLSFLTINWIYFVLEFIFGQNKQIYITVTSDKSWILFFFSIFLHFCWLKSSQISNCGPISFTKTLTKSKKKTFALLSLFLNSCFQW